MANYFFEFPVTLAKHTTREMLAHVKPYFRQCQIFLQNLWGTDVALNVQGCHA